MYVINYSSLVAVKELQPTYVVRGVFAALVAMVSAGRLLTVSLAWKAINDDDVYAALAACETTLVIRERSLFGDVGAVYAVCGDSILGNDPTQENPDPWLLALAWLKQASIVTEPSVLSRLPAACHRMGVRVLALNDMLNTEGIPH